MEKQSYEKEDGIMVPEITKDELDKILRKMKSKMVPGWNKIVMEHIKYGRRKLLQFAEVVFNVITEYEYVPLHFKKGIILAIPKGWKNALLQDNYRGLTLLPVLGKVYEKCVTGRMEQFAWDR